MKIRFMIVETLIENAQFTTIQVYIKIFITLIQCIKMYVSCFTRATYTITINIQEKYSIHPHMYFPKLNFIFYILLSLNICRNSRQYKQTCYNYENVPTLYAKYLQLQCIYTGLEINAICKDSKGKNIGNVNSVIKLLF